MDISPLGASRRLALPWMVHLLYQISIALSTHFSSAHPAPVCYEMAAIGSVPKHDLALLSSVPPNGAKRLDKMTQPR